MKMKSSVVTVLLIFASYSSATGYPLRKVVFPDESEESDEVASYEKDVKTDDDVDTKNLQPAPQFRINATNVPCSNANFCEEDHQQLYPAQYVESVLQKNASFYAKYFNKITTRDDFSDPINLCDTYSRMVYPKIAMNVESDWRFVINQPDYRQSIRVELCQKRSSQCQFSESFPLVTDTHLSSCTQKLTKIPLLSLDDDGHLTQFMYEYPSHCQCELHRKPAENRSHQRNE